METVQHELVCVHCGLLCETNVEAYLHQSPMAVMTDAFRQRCPRTGYLVVQHLKPIQIEVAPQFKQSPDYPEADCPQCGQDLRLGPNAYADWHKALGLLRKVISPIPPLELRNEIEKFLDAVKEVEE